MSHKMSCKKARSKMKAGEEKKEKMSHKMSCKKARRKISVGKREPVLEFGAGRCVVISHHKFGHHIRGVVISQENVGKDWLW